ncbi:MAG TPA: CocE/NonD family hydrolase [Solirubrobacteraceae bacterium]|nr:CocE/NonD family hydrolase [Solirubrobacteraceae bacterium]
MAGIRRLGGGCAATWLVVLGWALPAAPDAAAQVTGPDGLTAPTYSYQDATRERVYIPVTGVDQDADGMTDRVAIEIIRPQASGPALKVPAIIDASPYYSTVCRGNEGECIDDVDSDGVNDKWPLYYDNYFVPRGYAVILAEMDGTANSTGCPLHGGPGDIAGLKAVVDWLNGRTPGVDGAGNPVVADWHNGKSGMIGKSYDGTLANGVAATGVAGLETIVPISAISTWYRYSRMGGIRFNTHYPAALANAVTDAGRRAACSASRSAMSAADGDDTGDMNAFWDDRDYLADVGNVHAAVFATHGLQDDNVRLDHLAEWWAGLKANGVPRKLWLLREGHVDPFDSRRGAWVEALHRWFDEWLYGIDTGIMDEPAVDIEDAPDTWNTYADWPLPTTAPVDVHLRGRTADGAGAARLTAGGDQDVLTWSDASQSENTIINNPEGSQLHRRVFLSRPLVHDLRIAGTPVVHLRASLSTMQSNLGALLVDYGSAEQITRSGDGIANNAVEDCWGESSTGLSDYDACYRTVRKPVISVTQWRVSKGILDSSNRNSLITSDPLPIGDEADFTIPLLPNDFTFAAGHRIGIIVVANYTGFSSVVGTTGATITMDAKLSKLSLPVVGGAAAALASDAFADTTPPTLADMPGDVTVTAPGAAGAHVSYGDPVAADDETADPSVTCAPASGTLFPIGVTTVTCTAEDADGNTAAASFTITVEPPAAPAEPVAPEPHADTRAPRLRELRLRSRRHAIRVRFRVTEAADVTITLRRANHRRPLATETLTAGTYAHARRLRSKRLVAGRRYVVSVRAYDAAGNHSRLLVRRFTFHR